jgi:hypothetical protein
VQIARPSEREKNFRMLSTYLLERTVAPNGADVRGRSVPISS